MFGQATLNYQHTLTTEHLFLSTMQRQLKIVHQLKVPSIKALSSEGPHIADPSRVVLDLQWSLVYLRRWELVRCHTETGLTSIWGTLLLMNRASLTPGDWWIGKSLYFNKSCETVEPPLSDHARGRNNLPFTKQLPKQSQISLHSRCRKGRG